MTTTYVNPARSRLRLGTHHFAHLRAVAEGVDVGASAERYLGITHGNQARAAHQRTVDAVRAVARRSQMADWRLVGLFVSLRSSIALPSLEEFAAERGLEDFSEAEVAEAYAEAFPADPRARRRERLRERQRALLLSLERLAAEPASADDPIDAWLEPALAARLQALGLETMGDLRLRIDQGGRWWQPMPGFGTLKARRLRAFVLDLLPVSRLPALPFSAAVTALDVATTTSGGDLELAKSDDAAAMRAWVRARAGSAATARLYEREARRWLLWLRIERGGLRLGQVTANDCRDYMAFLEHLPPAWVSRQHAAPGAPGWAPFRGQLTMASRQQALVILAGCYRWLQDAQLIGANPWTLVNLRRGDDPGKKVLDTRALPESLMAAITEFVRRQPPSPSQARMSFILGFLESTGLRSTELLMAKLGDLSKHPEGWVMQVHGKGAKNRWVALPPQAIHALEAYLNARGHGPMPGSSEALPLLASSRDPSLPIGYQALYESVRRWLGRAVEACARDDEEKARYGAASTHWLRHTFGTKAVAKGVPLDVVQAQMGHASVNTTMNYSRAPVTRRLDELSKVFAGAAR